MATVADLTSAVDRFMSAEKWVVGADQPISSWSDGYSPNERVARFPLEVEGELLSGAHLMVVGFTGASTLKFQLSLCFNAAICRLDYTDETHTNSLLLPEDGLPHQVTGPHYHSWPINRRFFKSAIAAPQLHNAAPFFLWARTFDSILRWFCEDTRILGLPPNHRIELPRRDRLL